MPSQRVRHHIVYNFSELNWHLEAPGGIRQTGRAFQVAWLSRFSVSSEDYPAAQMPTKIMPLNFWLLPLLLLLFGVVREC